MRPLDPKKRAIVVPKKRIQVASQGQSADKMGNKVKTSYDDVCCYLLGFRDTRVGTN